MFESQDRLENLTNTRPFSRMDKLAIAAGAVVTGSACLALDASYLYPLIDSATRAQALNTLIHDAPLLVGANAFLLTPSAIHLAVLKGKDRPVEVWARRQTWFAKELYERYQFNKLDVRPESLRSQRVVLADFQGRIRRVLSADAMQPQTEDPDLVEKAFTSLEKRETWDGNQKIKPEQAGVLARWVGSTLAIEYIKKARSSDAHLASLSLGQATKALWVATEASYKHDEKAIQVAWMREVANQVSTGPLPKRVLRETFEKFVNDPPLAA